jgi:hypothetical protein
MRRDGASEAQDDREGRSIMITYTPATPLEAAVLESGRFEFSTDSAGREVICVGHRRLPRVVLQQKADGLHELVASVATLGDQAFTVTRGDPWIIDRDEPDPDLVTAAAEEYLVMGLRPMKSDGRPVRVASGRDVVRLFVLPWTMPAKTLNFGGDRHYVVTSTRGIVGDWSAVTDGRRGVIVGLPEVWVGILERQYGRGGGLAFRCDVPIPWMADNGLTNAVPTTVGVYELAEDADGAPVDAGTGETWVAKLPIIMSEGTVVSPVLMPTDLTVEDVPDGPWELEFESSSDFDIDSLS